MKMYKISKLIIFVGILFSVCGVSYAQEDVFTMGVQSIGSNRFNFVIGYSAVTISGCSNPKIIIDKGMLKFNSISGAEYQIDETTEGVLIISDFVPANLGSSPAELRVDMEFPSGTSCEGATQLVKASLCNKQATATVSVNENSIQDRLSLSISQKSPLSENNICYSNNPIKYQILAQNAVNSSRYGYYIYNGKVIVKLPSRAKVLSLYKMNSYSGVSYNEDNVKGEVSWNLPQEFGSNATSLEGFDLYLAFPCSPTPTTATGSHPSVYISGETHACEVTAAYTSSEVLVTGGSSFTGEDCVNCEGGGNLLLVDVSKNFPCLACPEEQAWVRYDLNVGTNNVDSTGVFQVRLPVELQNKIKGVYGDGSLKLYDGDQWIDYNPFNPLIFQQINVEKVLLVVDMKNPGTKSLILRFSNTQINDLPIYYSMQSGDSYNPFNPFIIEETSTLLASDLCSKQMLLSQYVNNSSVQTSDFFNLTQNLGNILPGQVLTYRVIVYNYGKVGLNDLVVTDALDSKLMYFGNLKYGYTSDFQPLTSELRMVPDNGILDNFPVSGNKAIVERPYIGQSGVITLRSFNGNPFGLPINCQGPKYLVLQFDVKVAETVKAGQSLQSIAKVYSGSDSEQRTSGGTVDYRLLTKADILAKCSRETNNDWISSGNILDNRIPIKAGEKVHYKMYFENKGTIPVELVDLVNTIPRSGDKFETTEDSRESQMSIIYTNEFQSNVTGGYELIYGTEATIPQTGSIFGTWDTNNIPAANQATWMRVHFDPPKLVNPGEKVEFIYYAQVTGSIGQIGNNSFAYNTKRQGESYYYVPGQTSVVSVEGSDTQCAEPPACENCASFDLLPGETYLVSAWVKEENENNPYQQFKNYDNSSIVVRFSSKEDNTEYNLNKEVFAPTGNIIDGWQRIIGEFKVPEVADNFYLELENTNTDERISYFDDVRVIPSKGNMKSFVYDQKTQRLMAELDENNYGTYYEYDAEGGLIRIKKETEKGVFTIQETRSSNPKK